MIRYPSTGMPTACQSRPRSFALYQDTRDGVYDFSDGVNLRLSRLRSGVSARETVGMVFIRHNVSIDEF